MCLRWEVAVVALLHLCFQKRVCAEFLARRSTEDLLHAGLAHASIFFSDALHVQEPSPRSPWGEQLRYLDIQGENPNALVESVNVSLEEDSRAAVLPRTLSSSQQLSEAPFILRLQKVKLQQAQGFDKYHSYVGRVVVVVAETLGLPVKEVQPVALLVYKDIGLMSGQWDGYGYVVILFLLEVQCDPSLAKDVDVKEAKGLCPVDNAQHKKVWSEALHQKDSPLVRWHGDQVDVDFAPQLTPELCARWEIKGPGCGDQSYMRTPYGVQEQQGLPLWFVLGVGSVSMLLCAMYPIYRMVKPRTVRPQEGEQRTPIEALKTDLREFKREQLCASSLEEDASCPICLVQLIDDLHENLLLPPCRHRMHACCAEVWFSKHLQCPMCRCTFTAEECVVEELYSTVPGDVSSKEPTMEADIDATDTKCDEEGNVSGEVIGRRIDDQTEALATLRDNDLRERILNMEQQIQVLTEERDSAYQREEPPRLVHTDLASTDDNFVPPLMPVPTTPSSSPTFTISDPRSSLMSMSVTCTGPQPPPAHDLSPQTVDASPGTEEDSTREMRHERTEIDIPL